MAKYNTPEDIPFFKEYNKNLYPNLLNAKYGIEDDFEDNENYACLIEQVLCLGIPGYEDEQKKFLVEEDAWWPRDLEYTLARKKENLKVILGEVADVYPSDAHLNLLRPMYYGGPKEMDADNIPSIGSLLTSEECLLLNNDTAGQWVIVEQIVADYYYNKDAPEDIKVYQKEAIEFAIEYTKVVMESAAGEPYPSRTLKDMWFGKDEKKNRTNGIYAMVDQDAPNAIAFGDDWCIVEQILGDELYGDTQDAPYPFKIETREKYVVKKPCWFYRVVPEPVMPATPA